MLTRTLVAGLVILAAIPALAQGAARGNSQKGDPRQAAQSKKEDKLFPQNVTWSSAGSHAAAASRPAFILDSNFRLKGFSGCNNFSATAYPLKGQAIAVGPLALTKKACDGATMAAERAFLTALRSTQQWDVEAGMLVLKSPRGTLRFERAL